jgi:uncharacterized protein YqkB
VLIFNLARYKKGGDLLNITFANRAVEKIKEKLNTNGTPFILLGYDIEGCGCVMSGVTFLEGKGGQSPGEIVVETNYLPILIQQKYVVFLDNDMKIDYQAKYNCFQLKSSNQILNPRMSFVVSQVG